MKAFLCWQLNSVFWFSEALERWVTLIFSEHICITWACFCFILYTTISHIHSYLQSPSYTYTFIAEDIAFLDHFIFTVSLPTAFGCVVMCICVHVCTNVHDLHFLWTNFAASVSPGTLLFLLLPLVSLAPSISHSLSNPTCLLSLCFLNLCVFCSFLFSCSSLYNYLFWFGGFLLNVSQNHHN